MSEPAWRTVWVVDNAITSIGGVQEGNEIAMADGRKIPLFAVLPVFDKASHAHEYAEGLHLPVKPREVTMITHNPEESCQTTAG